MKNFDVITVGNAIIDVFLTFHEDSSYCRLDKEKKELCFPLGGKIKVDHADLQTGGNANNVAVGLSRLGFQSAIAAEIGDDEFAGKIVGNLKHEHVDESLVKKTPHTQSSFAIGINYALERTLFVEHVTRAHDFRFEDVLAKWVYLTSLGNDWQEAYHKVLAFVEKNDIQLAFNPGTYQLTLLGGDVYHILSKTNSLFVNREEAYKIAGTKTDEIKELLKKLQSFGPHIVVITDGTNGSFTIDSKGLMRSIGLFATEVVERTGAGDGYASGFLGAILNGLTVSEAMRWGSVNAASVVSKVGAQPGLLTKEEIEKKLSENPEFQAKNI